MVSRFVAGLKKEVRLGVQMFRPTSLSAATSLARVREEKKSSFQEDPSSRYQQDWADIRKQQRPCSFPIQEQYSSNQEAVLIRDEGESRERIVL